jgi:hypothetical protein
MKVINNKKFSESVVFNDIVLSHMLSVVSMCGVAVCSGHHNACLAAHKSDPNDNTLRCIDNCKACCALGNTTL